MRAIIGRSTKTLLVPELRITYPSHAKVNDWTRCKLVFSEGPFPRCEDLLRVYWLRALPILLHWLGFRVCILKHTSFILSHWLGFRLGFSAPYLITSIPYFNTLTRLFFETCIPYLHTLTRLSTLYLKTCITYLNTLTRLNPTLLGYTVS